MRVNGKQLLCLAGLAACLLFSPASIPFCGAASSVNIPLNRDLYDDMSFWAAEGLIGSQLASIRPFTGSEVGRQLLEAMDRCRAGKTQSAACRDIQNRYTKLFDGEIAEAQSPDSAAAFYFKPVESFAVTYSYLDGPFSTFNNEGLPENKGHNLTLRLQTQARLGRVFSVFVEPLFVFNQNLAYGEDGRRHDTRLHKGYAKLTLFNLELQVGRDSLWWGPGYHGSLLMSTNARPFDMIKLSNPEPVLLPWILSYLGPAQFTLLFSQLNDTRTGEELANPFLYGMRLGLKPHPWLEVGASHLVLFGGPGRRHLSAQDVVKILYSNKNRDRTNLDSNQQFAADIALTVPNLGRYLYVIDGIKLYGEIGGEDTGTPPDRRAYIVGAALFKPFGLERAALRGEYAMLSPDSVPNAWYNHRYYPMRFHDRVFGHHAGSDAEDLFVEWSHSLDPFFYKLSYDWEKSGVKLQNHPQKKHQVFVEAGYRFNAHAQISLRYGFEDIRNLNHIENSRQRNHLLGLEAALFF